MRTSMMRSLSWAAARPSRLAFHRMRVVQRQSEVAQFISSRDGLWGRSYSSGTSSTTGPLTDKEKAVAFVIERGYSPEVAKAVVAALAAPDSGIPPGMLLTMVTQMAGRWEVGEDAGLEALVKSVEQEMQAAAGKKIIRFKVLPPRSKQSFDCEGLEGMSLKEVAEHGKGEGSQLLAEYIECACSGVMACSTCQVYVDPKWFEVAGKPSEAEQDMLELAHDPTEFSRLGCQLRLEAKLEGMIIEIPSGANNMFDFIPFEG
eukprot:TRINITY_DN54529_c0_g1_i1.p1 TRINITY_DN54529_c0_g1~~TRINITY_DN54529_c0_g1_i1.p1  ORF type:complete len:260 (-),score=54.49 TRINITY_DN54529_c0_g1_i1:20-799(-)